jgi:cytochrome c
MAGMPACSASATPGLHAPGTPFPRLPAAARPPRPRSGRSFPGPSTGVASHPPIRNGAGRETALAIGAILAMGATPARADDAAAEALMKKSNCLKCHAVDKKKEGPAFRDTAAKYTGKADAEAKPVVFLTTNPKVKVEGREESHDSLKTKNDADVKDVVRSILSR